MPRRLLHVPVDAALGSLCRLDLGSLIGVCSSSLMVLCQVRIIGARNGGCGWDRGPRTLAVRPLAELLGPRQIVRGRRIAQMPFDGGTMLVCLGVVPVQLDDSGEIVQCQTVLFEGDVRFAAQEMSPG